MNSHLVNETERRGERLPCIESTKLYLLGNLIHLDISDIVRLPGVLLSQIAFVVKYHDVLCPVLPCAIAPEFTRLPALLSHFICQLRSLGNHSYEANARTEGAFNHDPITKLMIALAGCPPITILQRGLSPCPFLHLFPQVCQDLMSHGAAARDPTRGLSLASKEPPASETAQSMIYKRLDGMCSGWQRR